MESEDDVSQFKETGFQLDPKKRPGTARRGRDKGGEPIQVLADPFASVGGARPDEQMEEAERVREGLKKAAEMISELKKENKQLKRQGDLGASLIPRRYYGAVAGAKKDLAKATGGKDGDYENDFRMAEVPRLLLKDPRALCYPPVADMFVHYLYQGKPAEVRKTLLAIHKQALQRQASAVRAMRIWEEKSRGKPIAEIARDENLSVSMVRKRLCEARLLLDPASAWTLAHGGGRRKKKQNT